MLLSSDNEDFCLWPLRSNFPQEPQNPVCCFSCPMTRDKFGYEYLDLFYLFFSMERTLKLSRTTLPWNTRRKASQQAWWRIKSRSAISTTAPGTRFQSTLTLITVSMQWSGLSVELSLVSVGVLPFSAIVEGRSEGNEKVSTE